MVQPVRQTTVIERIRNAVSVPFAILAIPLLLAVSVLKYGVRETRNGFLGRRISMQ